MALPGSRHEEQMAAALDRADYGLRTLGITNIEIMLWTYERMQDPQLLDLAGNTWQTFERVLWR